MSEQLDLFAEPRNKARAAADAGVLTRHLYLQNAWRTRRELMAVFDWPEWRVRHAADAADGDVIFGQRGMRHYLHATPEEFAKYVQTMKNQVKALQERIISSEKKFHSAGAGKVVA
jgi:hypothetical protein